MKHIRQTSRKRRDAKKTLIPVVFLICCVGFGISAWNFFTLLFANRQAEKAYSEFRNFALQETAEAIVAESAPELKTSEKKKYGEKSMAAIVESGSFSMDIAGLQKTYPELCAWLQAEGTGIDYPVMQAKDNDYYLTRLYDGTNNVNGSIFMDYRNTGVLTDDNTVIYGHNMKNGGMFNPLNEYKSQDFYNEYPTMTLCTAEGDYVIDLLCGTIESGDEEFVQFEFADFAEMSAYVDLIKARSTFDSDAVLQPGDRLVSLCTCNYDLRNGRYMLLGRVAGTADEN